MRSSLGRRFPSSFLTICLTLILTTLSFAQDLDNVTISGKITDSNNAPIVGANVTATLTENGKERSVMTDEEGRFTIIKLEPGTYTVKFSANGFGSKEQKDLATISGQNVQLNISLTPAGVTAEQTISIDGDDAPPIDTSRTVVGGTVTQREIEELPNTSRNPLDLIFTLGGVAEEPFTQRDLARDKGNFRETASGAYNQPEEAGVFSLSGGAAFSNNITIDGLDNNDDRSANLRFAPSLDAVAEVQVITNQFSAEYGRASGGRVNFRTRAGGKKFRGRVSYFFEDEALNANTWRNNSRVIIGVTENKRPARQSNIPVFSFGGPVFAPNFGEGGPMLQKLSKTFFFVAYEYQNIKENTLVDTFVPVQQNSRLRLPTPTDPALFLGGQLGPYVESIPTPLQNHIFSTRFDHRFTDNHSLTLNLQYGNRQDFTQFSGGTRLAETLIGSSRKSKAISLIDDYVFSAKVVNQARFQYSTLTPVVASDGNLTNTVTIINFGATVDGVTNVVAGASTLGSSDRLEKRWQFQDTVTVVAGSHIFKIGGDVQQVRSKFTDRNDSTGTYRFSTANDFLNNNVLRYVHNFGTTSELKNTYYGTFLQDEWRLKPNFVLNLGIRYENENILDDKNNIAPRVGVAWSPFKDNKGVIRFGGGIFYNRALLRTIDDNRLTLVNDSLAFDSGNLGTSILPPSVFQQFNNRFPNPLTETEIRQICSTYAINCTASGNFSNSMDPNIKLPESYQANIGFEREIGKDYVFEANYTWNKTAHLWRRVSTNSVSLAILNSKTGGNYSSFAEYLLSNTFNNAAVGGVRPIYNTNGARDVLIFSNSFTAPPTGDPNRCTGTIAPSNALQGGCIRINGVFTTVMNLNGPIASGTSSPQFVAAMNALRQFRPNPNGLTDAKQIKSIGNSEYNGLILEVRRRFRDLGYGFGSSLRVAYTYSKSMDDGFSNTSQAQVVGDFQSEWARSLNDRRHRLAVSASVSTPNWLGKMRFSPIFKYGSSAPFNLSAGGIDRNLDDTNTDRPNFSGNLNDLVFRNPGDPFPQAVFDAISLPTIGTRGGNVPRNAGRGPSYYMFDLNVSRDFSFSERFKLRPNIEINNILNARVFSFGGAFINSNDSQATFLVPSRTYRPREIRVGLRFDF